MSLLISEIDEIGRSLAQLVRPGSKPGSKISRDLRKDIRAVLREAVLATQGEGDEPRLESLVELLERLRELRRNNADLLGIGGPSALAAKLDERRSIGGVDEAFLAKGTFSTAGEKNAQSISAALENRIERTLAALGGGDADEARLGESRPLRHRDEIKELITKRVR